MKTKTEVKHAINWFEIPVKDINRAAKFYSAVFGINMHKEEMSGYKMAIFPGSDHPEDCTVHGALVESQGYEPSDKGALLYLNANPDLSVALGKVEKAGGKILKSKFAIGKYGFIAYLKDTEGNKVALHSEK